MPPVCHVLVVSSDAVQRQQVLDGLNGAATRLDLPIGLRASGAADGAAALQAVRRDGEIQAVLIDHAGPPAGSDSGDPVGIAQQVMRLRPELSVYMVLPDDDTKLLVEQLASDAIEGYFYRSETNHAGWLRIIAAALVEKAETPFYDQLKAYVALAKDSWHTPGHAGGGAYLGSPWVADFHDFVGPEMLRADLSVSVPRLDSLLHPDRRDRAGAAPGGARVRRAAHLFCHQR